MATIRVAAAGVVVTVVDGQVSIEEVSIEEASIGQPAAAVERGAAHFHRKTSADAGEGALRVNGAGRTNGAAAGSNGAVAHREPENRKRTGPSWTKAEARRLEALWPTHSAAAVARELGRNVNTVKHWARKLGLKKAVEPAVTVRPAQRQNGSGRPASRSKPSDDAVAGEGDPAPVASGAAIEAPAAAAPPPVEIPVTDLDKESTTGSGDTEQARMRAAVTSYGEIQTGKRAAAAGKRTEPDRDGAPDNAPCAATIKVRAAAAALQGNAAEIELARIWAGDIEAGMESFRLSKSRGRAALHSQEETMPERSGVSEWTIDEVGQLRALSPTLSLDDLADRLGRSRQSIRGKLRSMKLDGGGISDGG